MDERKLFGVLVRLLGLILMLWSMEWFVSAIYKMVRAVHLSESTTPYDLLDYLFAGAWRLATGLLVFRFADSIVRFGYPDDPDRCPTCGNSLQKPHNLK
jgi:hypothetical protein